jgi:hypothetical protein
MNNAGNAQRRNKESFLETEAACLIESVIDVFTAPYTQSNAMRGDTGSDLFPGDWFVARQWVTGNAIVT